MADKYHISPSTGNPNKCYASVKPCPLGGESDHYPTKEAARNAYEKSQSEGGQTVTKLRKSAAPAETSGKLASVTTLGGKTRTPRHDRRLQLRASKSWLPDSALVPS